MFAEASWSIVSQSDHTAKIVIQFTKFEVEDDGTDITGIEEILASSLTIEGLHENGVLKNIDETTDNLLVIIFPLPPKPLLIGQSADVPMKIPYDFYGSKLFVEGRTRITLEKYVNIRGNTCAVLEADIDISDFAVPENIPGDHSASFKGNSVFYFDINEHCFVSGTLHLVTETDIEASPEYTQFGNSVNDRIEAIYSLTLAK
ncbi:MAG: hypothetical protein GY845_13650 [Planctomycetes bacterium]|nr:hypothetical protein [Planctomycetota bacterium]